MARPTQVFLRRLRKKEQQLLKQKLRDKTVSARIYERYRVVEIARQGFPVPKIAERSGMFVTSIYDWIERFNAHGFVGFDDSPNPNGRPPLLTSKQLREMVKTALSRPTDLGLPYTHWSVAKLRAYLIGHGLFPDYTDE